MYNWNSHLQLQEHISSLTLTSHSLDQISPYEVTEEVHLL